MLLYFILVLLNCCNSHQVKKFPPFTVRLHGNVTFGYYYIYINVGTPPQKQTFLIDTASHMMAMPCQQCKNCNQNHILPNYNKTRSQTYQVIRCNSTNSYLCGKCNEGLQNNEQCKFSIRFMQGSVLSGNMLSDAVIFSDLQNNQQTIQYHQQIRVNSYFGCTIDQSEHFKNQSVNGIIGLAPNRKSNLLEQILKKNQGRKNWRYGFSLCLAINGGFMRIGNQHQFIHNQDEQTKIFKYEQSNNMYLINFQKIKIANKIVYSSLENITKSFIIDSGSSYTYFPPQTYYQIFQIILQACQKFYCIPKPKMNRERCFIIRGKRSQVMPKFPNIFIIFENGQTIQWTAYQYFVLSPFNYAEYCLGFQQNEAGFILGASWIKNKDIFFDLEKKELSITKSSCLLPEQLYKLNMQQKQLDQLSHNNSVRAFAVMGATLSALIIFTCYLNQKSIEKKQLRELKKKEEQKKSQEEIKQKKKNK